MMNKAFQVIAVAACVAIPAAAHAANADHVKGLWLTTDYPSIAARAGAATTLKLKLESDALPPEPVALSIDGVPAVWKATILGGGVPVAAAMPASNASVALSLRVDVPGDAAEGAQRVRKIDLIRSCVRRPA